MPVRIRVGTSLDRMQDISDKVNKGIAVDVASEAFEGRVAIYIKGFEKQFGDAPYSDYFERKDRKGVTWSIQFQGRFLQKHSTNDILFGNVFDEPLGIPGYIMTAGLKMIRHVDSTLEEHLGSQDKPWALSPVISTMNYLSHTRTSNLKRSEFPDFPNSVSIPEDVSQLPQVMTDTKSAAKVKMFNKAFERRAFFSGDQGGSKARMTTYFGPEDLVTADFCHNHVELDPEPAVRIPRVGSIKLRKSWTSGRPVTFVCCRRKMGIPDEDPQVPWGRTFWCVSMELVEDDESEEDEPEELVISDDID